MLASQPSGGDGSAKPLIYNVLMCRDFPGDEAHLFIGYCNLEFTPEQLIITGRRFPSVKHALHTRHAYKILGALLASYVGILLMPFGKLYLDILCHVLSKPVRLVVDRQQVFDVGGDRGLISFSIRNPDGSLRESFLGETWGGEESAIIAQLVATGGPAS